MEKLVKRSSESLLEQPLKKARSDVKVLRRKPRKKCEHGRRKSQCRDCGGGSFCEHKRRKSRCRDCGGASFCEHVRIKSKCKNCKGSSICEHNRQKSACKNCRGSSICEHNRQRSTCKNCKGSSICEHNRRKSTCKNCRGSSICEHEREKSRCKKCGGSALCRTELCETSAIKKYGYRCFPCALQVCPEKVKRNFKNKEHDVVVRLKEAFPDVTLIIDKTVDGGAVCSKKRPDVMLDMGSHVIIVEVDEKEHEDYDCSCEHKRMMLLWLDLQQRPVVFIRFNPDKYIDEHGKTVASCWRVNGQGVLSVAPKKMKEWQERIDCLKSQVQYWIDHSTDKTVETIELFYSKKR
jgi:hypothetical protein